jgi:hypothetical protein
VLKQALMQIIDADPDRNDRNAPEIPEDLEERLRSLGYLGGSAPK